MSGTYYSKKIHRQRLLKQPHLTCAYSGVPLTERTLTLDHVTPLIRGGTDSVVNIVPACAPCNMSKSGMAVCEWIPWC